MPRKAKRPEPPPPPQSLPEIHRAELEALLSDALERVKGGRVRALALALIEVGGAGKSDAALAGNATLGEAAALAVVAHEAAEAATAYYQAARDLGEDSADPDAPPFEGAEVRPLRPMAGKAHGCRRA